MGRHDDTGLGHGTGGSPQETLDQNDYNQAVDNLTNKFPPNDSQIKHIFRPKEGHLSDTPENRKLIENVANDPANYKGKDKYGNEWYSRNESDGSQVWVITRNGRIQNAGKNSTPRNWEPETGYSRNPKKANKWRNPK